MPSKKLVFPFLLFLLVSLLFSGVHIQTVEAQAPITVTRTFYSETYDGYIYASSPTYSSARNAVVGTIQDGLTSGHCGQMIPMATYYVYRSFLFFDTSMIPTDANITSAILSLYISANMSTTDFNVTIQNGQPTYPHAPLESGDYNQNYYSSDGGSRNTTTITSLDYWNITFSETGLGWLNTEDLTKLCLRSSNDIGSNAPSGNEYVSFKMIEEGSTYAPILYVTYECEGYHYIVHGPYYETGAVANCNTSVTLFRRTDEPYNFYLNGTDAVADTVTVETESQGWYFTWNASSYNITRVYYLANASFVEFWVYVTHPDEAFNLYTFTITDFTGLTNAYVETIINVDGQNRIVERRNFLISPLGFWMYWANRYDLRLVCDQGTYTWGGFMALAEYSQNLLITRDMFPEAYPGMVVSVNASRMNNTWIQTNYTDTQELTVWVEVDIQRRQGYAWLSVYTVNNTGNTHQIDWLLADNTTDYMVEVTAKRSSEIETWSFSCPMPSVTENPWEGLLDGLGEWPFPASQIMGLFIVLAVFAVFSYAYLPVGCILGILTAMILTYIGWLQIPWTLLGLGMGIAIFVAISEGKKREREI